MTVHVVTGKESLIPSLLCEIMKPKSNQELQAYFVELTCALERELVDIPKTNRDLKKEIKELKRCLESAEVEIPEFSEDTVESFKMFSGE